jgi:hypothetical protein
MDDPPNQSIQRVAEARRKAESDLKEAISGVQESDDVAAYLRAFRSFACALFDTEAAELLAVGEDRGGFESTLDEIASRIVESILPDRSLSRVTAGRTDEAGRLSVVQDLDTGLFFEECDDGSRRLAHPDILGVEAQHGDWETFAPKSVRFLLRWPKHNETVRAVLHQALQMRAVSWAGRFAVRITADRGNLGRSLDGLPHATPGENELPGSERAGAESMRPATKMTAKGRKRGPKTDHETASRVAEIVARVAPDGDWRSKFDDVCEALDDAEIPCPKRWRKDRTCRAWCDQPERAICVKAIEYRLKLAKQRKKSAPETLS